MHDPEPNDYNEDALRRRLRAADPVEALPEPEESTILQRLERTISTFEPPSRSSRRWLEWTSVAAAAALVVALGWRVTHPSASRAEHSAAPPSGEVTPATEIGRTRQLQFETPGGTRVVWVLDPDSTL